MYICIHKERERERRERKIMCRKWISLGTKWNEVSENTVGWIFPLFSIRDYKEVFRLSARYEIFLDEVGIEFSRWFFFIVTRAIQRWTKQCNVVYIYIYDSRTIFEWSIFLFLFRFCPMGREGGSYSSRLKYLSLFLNECRTTEKKIRKIIDGSWNLIKKLNRNLKFLNSLLYKQKGKGNLRKIQKKKKKNVRLFFPSTHLSPLTDWHLHLALVKRRQTFAQDPSSRWSLNERSSLLI